MAHATYIVVVRQHASEVDALADVEAILKLGRATVVNRDVEPMRQAGAIGLTVVLAGGALAALFRLAPIRRRAVRMLGDAIGAKAAAVAGRLAKQVKRVDVKNPRKSVDQRHPGRRKLATVAIEALADAALTPKQPPATAQLQAVVDAVKKEIERQDARRDPVTAVML